MKKSMDNKNKKLNSLLSVFPESKKRYIISYRRQGKPGKSPLLSDAMMRMSKELLTIKGATHIRVIDKERR